MVSANDEQIIKASVNPPKSINFAIEPLERRHNRPTFSCGNRELDSYFQRQINQDKKRNLAVPYIAVNLEN